jgi:RNA polymerase sigma-70 factor (ECF subfamily)
LGTELRNDADSLDILQDTYLAALRDFPKFEWRGDDSFGRWLNRIVSHRIADRADRLHTQKRSPVELPRLDPTGPVTALDRSEHREKVARALERLEPDHREVILLRYFEGLDAEQTGVRMQRSAGAVRKLCARALIEMEKVL